MDERVIVISFEVRRERFSSVDGRARRPFLSVFIIILVERVRPPCVSLAPFTRNHIECVSGGSGDDGDGDGDDGSGGGGGDDDGDDSGWRQQRWRRRRRRRRRQRATRHTSSVIH